EQSKAIGFGQRVKFANEQQLSGQVRLFSAENLFLGVALIDGNIIRPQRLITQSA
ncbi:tRNA pseudouridine(55) synthase TruB, partial [Haemophilus influenzae]